MENKDKPLGDIINSPAFNELVEAKALQTIVRGVVIARSGVSQIFRGIQERCDGIRAKALTIRNNSYPKRAKKGRKRT